MKSNDVERATPEHAELRGPHILIDGQLIGEDVLDPVEYVARFEPDVVIEWANIDLLGIVAVADTNLGYKRITFQENENPTNVTCLHEIAHLRTSGEHDDAWADAFKALLREAGLTGRIKFGTGKILSVGGVDVATIDEINAIEEGEGSNDAS